MEWYSVKYMDNFTFTSTFTFLSPLCDARNRYCYKAILYEALGPPNDTI